MGWSQFEAIPVHGVLEATYICSLDCVSLKARQRLASSIGGWPAIPADGKPGETVQQWAVLSDVPQEVVTLLEFLVHRFASLQQAFDACDAGVGDGKLNAREFTTGMTRLGFRMPNARRKRKGKPHLAGRKPSGVETERTKSTRGSGNPSAGVEEEENGELSSKHAAVLMSVYRFLDPNGDGAVTATEFRFLEGVWRELSQSTWEFVRLLQDLFGSVEASWDMADADGSGAIDFDEFQRLAQVWHFHGPLRQIFLFLAKAGAETVGKEEWLALERIEQPEL